MRSTDRPEIKFEVACSGIESVNFAEFHGFFEVTSNFELDSIAGRSANCIKARLLTFRRFFRALRDGYLDKKLVKYPIDSPSLFFIMLRNKICLVQGNQSKYIFRAIGNCFDKSWVCSANFVTF